MTPTPLNEIDQYDDAVNLQCIAGRVKFADPVKQGKTTKGKPWSNQRFVLEDATGSVRCLLWDALKAPVVNGTHVHFEGQGIGTNVEDYQGKRRLEVHIDGRKATRNRATGPGVSLPQVSQEPAYDRSARIERQHSQEMAIRYAVSQGNSMGMAQLRGLIDWFQTDIANTPKPIEEKKAEPEGDSIPF